MKKTTNKPIIVLMTLDVNGKVSKKAVRVLVEDLLQGETIDVAGSGGTSWVTTITKVRVNRVDTQ